MLKFGSSPAAIVIMGSRGTVGFFPPDGRTRVPIRNLPGISDDDMPSNVG